MFDTSNPILKFELNLIRYIYYWFDSEFWQ